jgi:glycosyltransferase involved in cell wall biosynthesis
MEAAACGVPTVASDSPGLRDSVRDGETGILVPHGDVGALAGALKQLLQNDAEREAMGTAARVFAESFSWDKSARAMEEFLQAQVTGNSNRR